MFAAVLLYVFWVTDTIVRSFGRESESCPAWGPPYESSSEGGRLWSWNS